MLDVALAFMFASLGLLLCVILRVVPVVSVTGGRWLMVPTLLFVEA